MTNLSGTLEAKLSVEPLGNSQQERQEWDDFVKTSNNGTIFHETKFLSYHPTDRFNFQHLVVRDDTKIVAVVPGGLDKRDPTIYRSPMGASYGGPVVRDINIPNVSRVVDALEEHNMKNGITQSFVTLAPLCYHKELDQNIEYMLLLRGYSYSKALYSSALELHGQTDEQYLNSIDRKARNLIKNSLKQGMEFKEDKDWPFFYHLEEETHKRFDYPITHTLPELEKLAELYPKDIRLFFATKDDKKIASMVLFVANERCPLVFYNAQDYNYTHLRPANFILYKTIEMLRKEGFNYLDFGVNQDTSPKTNPKDNPMFLNHNLIHFKERHGFRCMFRPTLTKRYEKPLSIEEKQKNGNGSGC